MDSSSETPEDSTPASSPGSPGSQGAPRRRWLRRLGVVAGVGGLATLLAGPPLAGRWLRGEIERQAAERVDGTVKLERVELGWNGKAKLVGLTVVDREGTMVANVPSARLDVGIRSFLTGKKDVAVHVDGATFELVRDEEGRWNAQDLLLPTEDDGPEDSEPTGPPPQKPLDVHGRIELSGATILLRSPETAMELRDVHFTIGLDGEVKETAVELEASLFGGDGSAGDFKVDLAVWPDVGPGLRVDECSAKGLDLGAVAEAMRLVGSPLEDGSLLGGTADIDLTGRIADLDPDASFEFQLGGGASALIVQLVSEGEPLFQFSDARTNLAATVTRTAHGGEPTATMDLDAREGKLATKVRWNGSEAPGLEAEVLVDGLAANAGLEPLLARVHPVFASAQAIEGANVDALITSRVDVLYDAPLPIAALAGGWGALPKEPFSGNGSLGVDEGIVRTSPFFAKVLELFGESKEPAFDLAKLGFAVDAGKIRYTDPWTWTIDGTETRFAGSVGLDQSLSLSWVVPIEGGLAQQNSVMEALAGETFQVALGGTLTSPSFDVAGAVVQLAERAGKKRIREEARELVGSDVGDALQEIIGGQKGAKDVLLEQLKGAAGAGAKQSAGDLLKAADSLWNAGKKQEAAKIYRTIRSDFPLSPTYLLNKKRVKGRRNG